MNTELLLIELITLTDVSKAFDKINIHGLVTKLMGRKLPRFLICIILKWYESNKVVVRWKSSMSHIVQLTHGVRQGGVLSPYFFAIIAVDEMLIGLNSFGAGCQYKHLPRSVCFNVRR